MVYRHLEYANNIFNTVKTENVKVKTNRKKKKQKEITTVAPNRAFKNIAKFRKLRLLQVDEKFIKTLQ